MLKDALDDLFRMLRRTAEIRGAGDLTDCQLLERFLTDRQESAFSVLVRRHGAMVFSVCHRLLGDVHAAEDCVQATFMVLAQRCAGIRKRASLGSWLYGVARRIALRAKHETAKRLDRQRLLDPMKHQAQVDDPSWEELRAVLDEEIARLPDKYQGPLILCCLESKSLDRAAKELGLPKSSLTRRLTRAKELLRRRLVKRGFTLTVPVLGTILAAKAAAGPVSAILIIKTVKAALNVAGGKALAAAGATAQATFLAEEALKSMFIAKGKIALVLFALSLAVTGAGVAGVAGFADKARQSTATKNPPTVVKIEPIPVQKKEAAGAADVAGEPLPDGALARLGSNSFRHADARTVTFSPDGKLLASVGGFATNGDSVMVWDTRTGRQLHRIPVPSSPGPLTFSPDGKILYTGALRSPLFVDIATGNALPLFAASLKLNLTIHRLIFSPEGKTAAACGVVSQPPSAKSRSESMLIVWDVVTGKELHRITVQAAKPDDKNVPPFLPKEQSGFSIQYAWIAFSADGRTLASAGKDIPVQIWDVQTGKELRHFEPPWELKALTVMSPDAKFLATPQAPAEGHDVMLLDMVTGKASHVLKGDASINARVAFSQDAKVVAGADNYGVIYLWETDTGNLVRKWQSNSRRGRSITPIYSLAFSPDAKTLVSTSQSAIDRWDTATGKQIEGEAGHTGPIKGLQFAMDGKTILSAGDDAKVLAWDLSTHRLREAFGPFQSEKASPQKQFPMQLPYPMIDLSAASKVVALKRGGGGLQLFDIGTGKPTHSLGRGTLTYARFSPDGKLLAVPSGTAGKAPGESGLKGVELWDVAEGKVVQRIEAPFTKMSFSADGKLLATCQLATMNADPKAGRGETKLTVGIWDATTGKQLHHWKSQSDGGLAALELSPDGKYVAAARHAGGVQVWAAGSGKELFHLPGPVKKPGKPADGPFALAYSPSGRILAVGWTVNPRVENGVRKDTWTLQLLEAFSGKEIRKFEVDMKSCKCLAFAPNGRTLASSEGESTILLWDLTGHQNNAKARGRPLSEKDLEVLWSDLAGDAAKAEPAIWTLVFSPAHSVPVLKQGLKLAVARPDDVAKLVGDLDTNQYAVRQKAIAALVDMDLAAESTVNKIMADGLPLEQQQRLKPFLDRCRLETLRHLRVVDVLEQIGTDQARELLAAIAKGSPTPEVGQFAAAALDRYAKAAGR